MYWSFPAIRSILPTASRPILQPSSTSAPITLIATRAMKAMLLPRRGFSPCSARTSSRCSAAEMLILCALPKRSLDSGPPERSKWSILRCWRGRHFGLLSRARIICRTQPSPSRSPNNLALPKTSGVPRSRASLACRTAWSAWPRRTACCSSTTARRPTQPRPHQRLVPGRGSTGSSGGCPRVTTLTPVRPISATWCRPTPSVRRVPALLIFWNP